MQFLKNILVPSVNYGVFLDTENEKEKYNQIDAEIAEFYKDLLS